MRDITVNPDDAAIVTAIVAMARSLGVDVIEAGFPAASRGDWDSVNAVAREGGRIDRYLGDGILALFDGPARAVEAARRIVSQVPRNSP